MALAPNTAYGMLNPGTTNPNYQPQTPGSGALLGGAVGSATGSTVGPTVKPGGTKTNTPATIGGALRRPLISFSGPAAWTTITPPSIPAAPAPNAGGTAGAGDFTLDPSVQAALAMEQQGLSQLDAQLKAARDRAIINFGDPALASEAGFGLDPQAAAFTQQNYLSGNATLARLAHQHDLNARDIVNQLAAHGILNSGDYGYREGEENRGYGNNVYDARQAVLDQLANLYSNYLGSRQGYQQNILNALLSAAQNAGTTAGNGYYDTGTLPTSSQPSTAATVRNPLSRTTYSQPRKGVKPVTGPSILAFK